MDIAAQVDRYVELGHPPLAGLTEDEFRAMAQPLVATGLEAHLILTRELIDPEARVPGLRLAGSAKEGILDRNHASDARVGLAPYAPREELQIPQAGMYLLVGFERGDEFRDVAPLDARPQIAARGRTPLTIDEGLSILELQPEVLIKNHCFMLDGSTRGDKRVPALWISAGAPKLGWCFDKVPHAWLGIASAATRVA